MNQLVLVGQVKKIEPIKDYANGKKQQKIYFEIENIYKNEEKTIVPILIDFNTIYVCNDDWKELENIQKGQKLGIRGELINIKADTLVNAQKITFFED